MKKLFLIIVILVSALFASAQEKNSLQSQAATIYIDSLSVRLDRLQHDYDFLSCDYQLNKLIVDLKELSNSIDSNANGVVINVYNGRYRRDLYNAYQNNYEGFCQLFESLKKKAEAVKKAVILKLVSSDFSDEECSVLAVSFDVVEKAFTTVEKSLNLYNIAIEAYRDKR